MSRLPLCLLLALACCCRAFYLPMLAPTFYCTKEFKGANPKANCQAEVFVHVNKLDSVKTLVPYEYSSFDFCQLNGTDDVKDRDPVENLGQVVFGERLRASAYNINFKQNQGTKELCTQEYTRETAIKLQLLRERIHEDYMQQWVVDNMPVTWCYSIMESDKSFCSTYFPIGCYVTEKGQRHGACFLSDQLKEPGATYVFNTAHLILTYQGNTLSYLYTDGRIVRAQVQLASCETFNCTKPLRIPDNIAEGKTFKLPYSYSVQFLKTSNIRWANRWDYILSSAPQSNLHWIGFIICVLTAILLSLVGRNLRPAVHRDLMCYEQPEPLENCGQKMMHGDLFRPVSCIMLLSVCVGSGIQILFTTFIALVFACLGFLSLPNRGALLTTVLVLYVLMGAVAGYISARLYKTMGGLCWKSTAIMTAFFVPGVVFAVFFMLNLFLWRAGSFAAIPFTALLVLLYLWFGVSLPLTLFGSFFGFRKPAPVDPIHRVVLAVFFILNLFLWRAGSSAGMPFATLLVLLYLWFGVSLLLTFFGTSFGFRRLAVGLTYRAVLAVFFILNLFLWGSAGMHMPFTALLVLLFLWFGVSLPLTFGLCFGFRIPAKQPVRPTHRLVLAVFFMLSLFLWRAGSSAAMPFTALLVLLYLWFGVSLPFTFFESFFEFRRPAAKQPVHTCTIQIPREIPDWKCLYCPIPSSLIGSLFPFGCVVGQLQIILDSIWSRQIYCIFGLTMVAFLTLLVVCVETAVVLCYLHFRADDYNWCWRSFFSTGTSAFYIFLYSIFYCVYKTSITGVLSYLLYFGYTFVMVFLFFIMTGTVGFLSSLLFVNCVCRVPSSDGSKEGDESLPPGSKDTPTKLPLPQIVITDIQP